MKCFVVTLLIVLQYQNICVSGSATTGKKIVRGSENRNRELTVIRERKEVPATYALKAGLKRARVTRSFSVSASVPSPSAEARPYSLAKTPGTPTPPSVLPPQTPVPSESPSSQPSLPPTKKPTPFPTLKPVKVPTDTLTFVGINGNPYHAFPLAMCEGDCDTGKTLKDMIS